ncbi:MAG: Ig-like domain-containing protein [Chlorobium sp.]|jgi:uncharacterized protein (DUF2141 family)|nr:Ig-like domain-containing protein [Chlorobium sp.]
MQSTSSRIITVPLILLLSLAGGCASDIPPSGGAGNTGQLQLISSYPEPSSVNVSTSTIRLTFNHDITALQLLNALLISPSIGEYDMTTNGKAAELRLDSALARNQTYSITINKTLRDNQGRTLAVPFTMAFSTGIVIDNSTISGKVINNDFSPAINALILAFAEQKNNADKENLLTRRPDYVIQAEASGDFSFKHLTAGSYRIIAVNDRNNDLRFTAGSEEIGLSSIAIIPTGSVDLLFRLSRIPKSAQPVTVNYAATSSDTGSISGRCFAAGQETIVEALSQTASCSTTASRDKKGIFTYSFPALPPGTYTVNAFISSKSKNKEAKPQWNPGSIHPYQPAEPFGYYPETITVRPRWKTDHIDIHIKNAL